MKEFNKLLMATALFLISGFGAKAQEKWTIQPTQIKTRWSSQVSSIKPLNDYPRPQLERKHWINLNGLWDYSISRKNADPPKEFNGKILVPYPLESALSGIKRILQPDELLWYKTSFLKPTSGSNERILLHFGAVDFEATVFVNGHKIGKHTGGYTSFTIDISDQLKSGNNKLVVKVWDPTDKGIGPNGKQSLTPSSIYYTPTSGIWQTVWMETVPIDYISKLTITPDIDKSLVNVTVHSISESDVQLTAAGKIIKGKTNTLISVPIDNPKLWTPDDPFLYNLEVKLGSDEVKSYFGMRKISLIKDKKGIERIALNNKPYYNLGVLDQGFWPDGLYTAPTDEALAFDIKASKAMGFNTIRKHIKIEPARWYYYTDKLGMLVWQDMVNPGGDVQFQEPKTEFERESKEILEQLHNYPSITTWVLFNERWGQYDQDRLTRLIKDIDPSRLVNGHSGEYLYVQKQDAKDPVSNAYVNSDITDVHSYPNPMMPEKQEGKAQVLGEFGGIGVVVPGHLWDDTKTGWGYDRILDPPTLRKQYSAMMDTLAILKEQGLSGSIYTQPFDVETEQNGLITYDRELTKLPIETLRKLNAKVWPITSNYKKATEGFQTKVADSISVTYEQQLAAYKNGNREETFLRQFALMANDKKQKTMALQAANEYLSLVQDPFTEGNMNFIDKFIKDKGNKGYQLIKENPEKTISYANSKNVPFQIWDVIYATQFKQMLTTNPDWKAIQLALDKYPNFGAKIIFYPILNEYMRAFGANESNALNNLFTAMVKFDNNYHMDGGMLNQTAWFFFEKVSDKNMLTKASEWSKRSIDEDLTPKFWNCDTYANLLYKLGQVNDAIEWETKAVKLSYDNEGLKDTLEKMKNGVKTWKE